MHRVTQKKHWQLSNIQPLEFWKKHGYPVVKSYETLYRKGFRSVVLFGIYVHQVIVAVLLQVDNIDESSVTLIILLSEEITEPFPFQMKL